MNSRDIRDKLLKEQALYEQSVIQSKQAISEIKEVIDGITEDSIRIASQYGVDLVPLKNMDLERMQTDDEYLKQCIELQQRVSSELHRCC